MPHFESLKLYELKLLARELNIPVKAVREHGDLRHRQTWLDAIASAIADIEAEAIAQKGASSTSGHFDQKFQDVIATSDQNDHKFAVIQNEVGFVDGQLAIHIPLAQAQSIAVLVRANRWGEAFQIIHDNPTATRILKRIWELQQEREEVAA